MTWLRALGQKLHRLAQATKAKATSAFHAIKKVPRIMADRGMSILNAVVSRNGFQAAVSLLATAGRLLRIAVEAGMRRIVVLARRAWVWTAPSLRALARQPLVRAWTVRVTGWGRDPWIGSLLLLGAVTAVLTAALLRRRCTRSTVESDTKETARLSDDELELVMARMFVVMSADGSILIHGIPMTLTTEQRVAVAHVAAKAATDHLHQLVLRGRPISTVDLQGINLAARSAVGAQFGKEGPAA